jgi:hypothetical protein
MSSKNKKGHDAEGPPIALGAPNLEGPRGIFPTSLYGQSTPACRTLIPINQKKIYRDLSTT